MALSSSLSSWWGRRRAAPAPPPGAPIGEVATVDAAFDAAYREHKSYVWHSLRRLGVREADRPDLVHDVFLAHWQRRTDVDLDRPLRPWLFGICYRVVQHHRRRVLRHPEEALADGDDVVDAPVAARQDELIDRKRARALIDRALSAMDLDQRAVFVLHDVDGENIAACARALDVSANTLYSRLRLARKKLADVVAAANAGGAA